MVLEEVSEGSNPLYQGIKRKETPEDEVTANKTRKPLGHRGKIIEEIMIELCSERNEICN